MNLDPKVGTGNGVNAQEGQKSRDGGVARGGVLLLAVAATAGGVAVPREAEVLSGGVEEALAGGVAPSTDASPHSSRSRPCEAGGASCSSSARRSAQSREAGQRCT